MPACHPYSLKNVLTNPLALMLPLHRLQEQVYRMAERLPPSGGMHDHAPSWECVSMVLAARDTSQVRVNLQRDFHLMAIACGASSIVNGGFRAQFFDTKKQRRLADRGVMFANIAGSNENGAGATSPSFLREPYVFDQPDSQLLVIVQNMETAQNTIQIAFYGQVLRFNADSKTAPQFPGGPIHSAGSGVCTGE
jgi:hypothetical protein